MISPIRVFATSLLAASSLAAAQPAAAQDCDQTCLRGWVDDYLAALVKHDPTAVNLASDVRFTANGQLLEPGDGLWRTFKERGKFIIVVPDVVAQQVTAIVTFAEEGPAGAGGALGVRLQIRDGQITEIEQRETHDPEAYKLMESAPVRPAFTRTVPPAERMSRHDLARIANAYFAAIQLNDGKGFYPLGDDCDRYTNGIHATNVPTPAGETRPDPKTSTVLSNQWSCREQFESGLLHFVTRVRDRRIVAIDQEHGLVFAFGFFDHSAGDTRTFTIPDGRTVTSGPTTPFTWSIVEIFKITDGVIHEIQALELERPYGMQSGWSSWEDGMSDRMQDQTGAPD